MDKEVTRVIFRKWRYKFGGDILALFPIDGVLDGCVTYQHIGQHGTGDYQTCISNTVPASPAEYKDLKAELESLGYNLKVISRYTPKR